MTPVRQCIIAIALALCLLAIARLLQPGEGSALRIAGSAIVLPELCFFRRTFGTDCPGCGLTRSVVLAARFQFAQAWSTHPVGLALVIYLATSIPLRLWRLTRLAMGKATPSPHYVELALLVLLTVVAYARWTGS